ncbi:hypothetical protein BQ6471_02672 [Vibrio gazogenes]|nr:hypothetical protein BQ6471_02672 [Vibrio gazogenes]
MIIIIISSYNFIDNTISIEATLLFGAQLPHESII